MDPAEAVLQEKALKFMVRGGEGLRAPCGADGGAPPGPAVGWGP